MITTRNVHMVSDGGHDVKCSKEPLTFNSHHRVSQVSMNAFTHMVDHAKRAIKMIAWGGKMSSAVPADCLLSGILRGVCGSMQ
jgi:hypothetical protein